MTKFFDNKINIIFGLIFSQKLHTTSHWFLPPYQSLEKTGDPIQSENLDRGNGWQTLFQRTNLATPGGPIWSAW